jgi:ribonuclease P protein component
VASRSFVLLLARQPAGIAPGNGPRLGITTSRRVGAAVERTRVRRRIREWFRTHKGFVPKGNDLVVIARSEATRIDAASFGRELQGALVRLTRRTRT